MFVGDKRKAVYTETELKLFRQQKVKEVKPALPPKQNTLVLSGSDVNKFKLPARVKATSQEQIVFLSDSKIVCMGKSGHLFVYSLHDHESVWESKHNYGLKDIAVVNDNIYVCTATSQNQYQSRIIKYDSHGNVQASFSVEGEYWNQLLASKNRVIVAGKDDSKKYFFKVLSIDNLQLIGKINEAAYSTYADEERILIGTRNGILHRFEDGDYVAEEYQRSCITSITSLKNHFYFSQGTSVYRDDGVVVDLDQNTVKEDFYYEYYIDELIPSFDMLFVKARNLVQLFTNLDIIIKAEVKEDYLTDDTVKVHVGEGGFLTVEQDGDLNPTSKIRWRDTDIEIPKQPHKIRILCNHKYLVLAWGRSKDRTVKIVGLEDSITISGLETPSFHMYADKWFLIDQDNLYTG